MQYIFTGSYTSPDGKDGVRCFAVSPDGILTPLCTANAYSPTYVLYHHGNLYTTGRCETGCCIRTFAFNGHSLTPVHCIDSPGGSTCHISIVGDTLYACNYSNGELLRCQLDANGIPTGELQIISYTGSGPHPRQDQPHIHSAFPSPDNRFLLVCDLGSDRIYNYSIGPNGSLTPNVAQPEIITPAGSGPRHLTYSKDGTHVYAITELSAQVLAYHRDIETGILEQIQVTDCVPKERPDDTLSADIHLSDDEQFLYASSRGVNYMAVYHIRSDKMLSEPFYLPVFTSGPRHFSFQPDGEHIVITGQYTDTVVVCALDKRTGLYGKPICEVSVPQSTCAQWVEVL